MEAEDAEGWLRMRDVHGEGYSSGRQILGFQSQGIGIGFAFGSLGQNELAILDIGLAHVKTPSSDQTCCLVRYFKGAAVGIPRH